MKLLPAMLLIGAAAFTGWASGAHRGDGPEARPAVAADGAGIVACFTPGADCTGLLADTIGEARNQILVQAYGFTSAPILKALTDAAARGVEVRVILDKSNESDRYSGITFLRNHGIAPLIDDRVAIAHSKVMVIDGQTVVTGSFNFTKAAQERNAENLLILSGSPGIAALYIANWNRRAAASRAARGAN